MKKIFIILFVFYLSFINCDHDHDFSFEEKLNFIEQAMSYIAEKYVDVINDCDDTFSATVTFGVLFTNDEDFEKDLNNIKSLYSSNVIDLVSDKNMESGLIDKENKMDNAQQKVVIYKNPVHDGDKYSFIIIEVNFTNLNTDDLKCPFVVALDSMFNNVDYDLNELANNNYKVVNFKFN
jgi:hypothetical protein